MSSEGWEGWDSYAPFYDWENARTLGRRDVPFWRRLAVRAAGPVLELGCGTGRVSVPLARAGVRLVGLDRSAEMLARARQRAVAGTRAARLAATRFDTRRARTAPRQAKPPLLVRGDIRDLPFASAAFAMVLAPYGILQSLLSERDLAAALASIRGVLAAGGLFGIDLVPDVANWQEYDDRVQLRGRAQGGAHLTLVESVRQDRRRRLTRFHQQYIVRRGSRREVHQFDLTFRTLSVDQMARRLLRAGFQVESVLGDYRGKPWDARADVWIILARAAEGRGNISS